MGTGELNAGGNPAMDWHPIQGGVEIFLVASCHGNRDKLRPGGPLGSYADFTSLYNYLQRHFPFLCGLVQDCSSTKHTWTLQFLECKTHTGIHDI